MDDTIFDHSLTCRAAIARVRRRHSVLRAVALDELWREYQASMERTHPDVMKGRLTGQQARDARWNRLLAHHGPAVAPSVARALSEQYRAEYLKLQRAVPGAAALLRYLHGKTTIAIVTNNEVAEQERKLRFLGIEKLIDHLVVSEEVGVGKPDPRIFRVALRRAGARARESVMIGDSWANDVLGARAAGIRPIWFNRFRLPQPAAPPAEEIASFAPLGSAARSIAHGAAAGAAPVRIISRAPMQTR